MDNKSIAIVVLSIALIAVLLVTSYTSYLEQLKKADEEQCNQCRLEGMNNTFKNMVAQIKLSGSAIQIKVDSDQLICSTAGILYGTD